MEHRPFWVACALLILASALLGLTDPLVPEGFDSQTDKTPSARWEVKPSPTWAPMPTRRSLVSAELYEGLDPVHAIRVHLQMHDPKAALLIWQCTSVVPPPYQAIWYRSGSRIYLALGDLDKAESLARVAMLLEPISGESWLLLQHIYRAKENWLDADRALTTAISLEPMLSQDLFADRWLLVTKTNDVERLSTLASEYANEYPTDPLRAYFEAKALLASGNARKAIGCLIEVLEQNPGAPMLLWYTLGEAYLAQEAYQEAVSAFEVSAERLAKEGKIPTCAEAPFLYRLNHHLAQAYLGSGKCAYAQAILRWLTDSGSEFAESMQVDKWIEQAISCQTPTPTLTPWIPEQIGTPTPAPP